MVLPRSSSLHQWNSSAADRRVGKSYHQLKQSIWERSRAGMEKNLLDWELALLPVCDCKEPDPGFFAAPAWEPM